jgi:hypothetical protein
MNGGTTKHLDFSEQEKSELSGYFGILPEVSRLWVPEIYRKKISDKSKWPVFIVRTYTGVDQMFETDFLSTIQMEKMQINAGNFSEEELAKKLSFAKPSSTDLIQYRLQRCVAGCKNFFDQNGDEVIFTSENSSDGKKIASRSFLERLPYVIQMELFSVITKSLVLSEEEKMGLDS